MAVRVVFVKLIKIKRSWIPCIEQQQIPPYPYNRVTVLLPVGLTKEDSKHSHGNRYCTKESTDGISTSSISPRPIWVSYRPTVGRNESAHSIIIHTAASPTAASTGLRHTSSAPPAAQAIPILCAIRPCSAPRPAQRLKPALSLQPSWHNVAWTAL
eukprot:4027219-Pleurochrysis_carterae.AAC.1